MIGNAVSVTLNNNSYRGYKQIAKEGDIIKVKGKKRLRLIVTGWRQEDGYGILSTNKAYCPAPKSRLNKKSKFSKVKIKIIKH